MQIMHNLFFQFIFIKVFYLLLVIYETMNNAFCVTWYGKIAIIAEKSHIIVERKTFDLTHTKDIITNYNSLFTHAAYTHFLI